MNIVDEVLLFAINAHDGQYNKYNNEPYILHVVRVWLDVRERYTGYGGQIYQSVALLHDVLEDTDVSLEYLNQKFGPRIARPVEALTKRPGNQIETTIIE